MLQVTTEYKRDLTTIRRRLKKMPDNIRKEVEREWNGTALDFVRLMQDKHLSGGTTADRLQRISSLLYNSIEYEVKPKGKDLRVAVYFTSAVEDYAEVHEYGDSSRNIPARMNLRNEWKKYMPKFIKSAEAGIAKGIKK